MRNNFFNMKTLFSLSFFALIVMSLFCCGDGDQILDNNKDFLAVTRVDSLEPDSMEKDTIIIDTLKNILDVDPQEWIVGEWTLVKSTVAEENVGDIVYSFSSDGTCRLRYLGNNSEEQIEEEQYVIVPQQGYMATAIEHLVAPFEYCLKIGYNGHYDLQYGIVFVDDKMYLTGINSLFFHLYSYIYKKID